MDIKNLKFEDVCKAAGTPMGGGSDIVVNITKSDTASGISKRDFFAAMALNGILSNSHKDVVKAYQNAGDRAWELMAKNAYRFADEMIKAGE